MTEREREACRAKESKREGEKDSKKERKGERERENKCKFLRRTQKLAGRVILSSTMHISNMSLKIILGPSLTT